MTTPNLVVHRGHRDMDPGSLHIVYPEWACPMDESHPDNLDELNRARNLPLVDAVRSLTADIAAAKNLSADHAKALQSQVLCGFVGSKADLEDFASRPRHRLSAADKSSGVALADVYGWAEPYFRPGFFERMMSTMLIGYPIMGPGELFLCAMTDYRRPTEQKGDLVGESGYAEVKAEGRLGGQRPDRDGQQSRQAVATLIGSGPDDAKSWGASSYKWLDEALAKAPKKGGVPRRRLPSVVLAMMNYDCPMEDGMVQAMTEDSQSFHVALHLHCYASRRGFGEVLFLSKDRKKITAYTGKSFADALLFSRANLRNRGGWGGWSQDRSGVQVEH